MDAGYARGTAPIHCRTDERPAAGCSGVARECRQHVGMDTAPRWYVKITTSGGGTLYWHRAGGRHTLSQALGAHWVANFKPALFQVTPEGAIIPRDSQPGGLEILGVDLETAPPA